MDINAENESNIRNENQISHERESENSALLSEVGQKDKPIMNSREFVEKSDDILSFTNELIINLSEKPSNCEPFQSNGVTSVFNVFNAVGDHVFTLGQCPVLDNIQSFVISNAAGHGLMTFTTKGLLSRVCEVAGAGLLSFTQIQHIHGGYTLRDPYKELVKIRPSWIPFCTCCIVQPISSATMVIADLDGTKSGSISFKNGLNLGFESNVLCLNFIPNLNPKAKYMLLAASLRLMSSYFTEPGRKSRGRYLILFYLLLIIIMLIICILLIKIV